MKGEYPCFFSAQWLVFDDLVYKQLAFKCYPSDSEIKAWAHLLDIQRRGDRPSKLGRVVSAHCWELLGDSSWCKYRVAKNWVVPLTEATQMSKAWSLSSVQMNIYANSFTFKMSKEGPPTLQEHSWRYLRNLKVWILSPGSPQRYLLSDRTIWWDDSDWVFQWPSQPHISSRLSPWLCPAKRWLNNVLFSQRSLCIHPLVPPQDGGSKIMRMLSSQTQRVLGGQKGKQDDVGSKHYISY